ncbi:hypothetical protein ACFLIM_48250 [Nonomuraea sp. M3C6]|uniref:Uncharacterized protein n=1 Tax=Nonomuraea marmarensis TaxID=3351344 RepID=A0ABW7AY78_9ACTN
MTGGGQRDRRGRRGGLVIGQGEQRFGEGQPTCCPDRGVVGRQLGQPADLRGRRREQPDHREGSLQAAGDGDE